MKKFYSLVLMAAALLVSTTVWAGNFSGTTRAQLQKAIADIIYGTVSDPEIKLQNNVDLDETIWVGTENLDPASYKSITLDLNGHSITYNSGTATNRTLIALTHGELKIINTAANEATLGLTGSAKDGSTIVSVYGSYRSSRWNDEGTALVGEGTNTRVEGWCSHLEIGSNVKLYAEQGCEGTGLYVGPNNLKYPKADGTLADPAYPGWVMTGNIYSFSHGVRVDFYGKIDFQGTNSGKAYGIKTNGTLRSPLSWANSGNEAFQTKYTDNTKPTSIPYIANYLDNNADINTNATLATDATHKRDTVDAPFIWIHPGAEVNVRDAGSKVTALYGAGYAKWLVQGYAEGKTGMYVSSGVMDLNDAYVKSTAAEWQSSTSAGSANGGGSGVVINSRDSYSGGIEFTVSGDTHIESIEGYAIEEIVNTTSVPNPKADPENPEYDPEAPATIQVTKVADITIEGGTISGGDEGAIVVSTATLEEAAKNENVEVVIYGGNVIGDSYAGDKGAVTTGDLNDLMPKTGDYHTTEVTDEKGNTIIVVSQGDAPDAGDPITGNMVSDQLTDASVKWTVNTKDTIKTDLKLAELEINTTGLAHELVIKENATLTVGRVVLGKDARIIVEAGGKFIVTGAQGVVAPSADNIILQTSEAAPATFLFDPSVTSNRHPNATVKLLAKEIGYETFSATKYWYWSRFALPIKKATTWSKSPNVTSYIYKWSYENDDWQSVSALTEMEPFKGYILTANQGTLGDVEYTFTGELAGGNESAALQFARNGFHFFGNSYTGHISIDKLVEQIMGASDIDGTVWVWGSDQNYHAVPLMALRNNPAAFPYDWQKEVAPMQTFVLKHNVNTTGSTELNYATAVWGNPRYNSFNGNAAPRRHVADETTHMNIVITAENGKSDFVMFMEDGLCSDEYDNGYDGTKYMNEESLNMYASVNGANYSVVATDNIEGKLLTINTVNDVNYTMTFANVNGEEYAVRDNVTGAVIAIEEGGSYEFAAQPNIVAEGRFEIVKVSKVATDIENTEVKANAKGIYTIMGQYVGVDFEALPAGIYVVNGVKIVK